MAITEEKLLASGFTPADVQKLKNNIDNYGGSFELLINNLSNRFRANIWISIAVLLVCLAILVISSLGDASSGAVAGFIALAIVWLTIPISLAYKAWFFKRNVLSSQEIL